MGCAHFAVQVILVLILYKSFVSGWLQGLYMQAIEGPLPIITITRLFCQLHATLSIFMHSSTVLYYWLYLFLSI